MLKQAASFVLASLNTCDVAQGYASASRSLRPCWTTCLNIVGSKNARTV
jgi:hypothetical protein